MVSEMCEWAIPGDALKTLFKAGLPEPTPAIKILELCVQGHHFNMTEKTMKSIFTSQVNTMHPVVSFAPNWDL